jgi:pyridoxine 4-dehydrogenase
MKTALDNGCVFWNAGDFYGTPEYNSLHLLKEYFTRYPEDAAKVVLSIKSGINLEKHFMPDGTPEFLERCVENCLKVLDGKKSVDIFEMARVPKNVELEVPMKFLEGCVKEGRIGGIGLSECSAATIKKAAAVTKIAAVEVEMSLFSTDILSNGVLDTCAELDIPIVAYVSCLDRC